MTNLTQRQRSSGTTQSRPFPARAVKSVVSAAHLMDVGNPARAGKRGRPRLDQPLPGNREEALKRGPRGADGTPYLLSKTITRQRIESLLNGRIIFPWVFRCRLFPIKPEIAMARQQRNEIGDRSDIHRRQRFRENSSPTLPARVSRRLNRQSDLFEIVSGLAGRAFRKHPMRPPQSHRILREDGQQMTDRNVERQQSDQPQNDKDPEFHTTITLHF